MQRYLIFFTVILAAGFIYFSYISLVSTSMKNQAVPAPSRTDELLSEQSQAIKRLNQDYRDIIDQSKRQLQDATHTLDQDVLQRDHDRTMEENRRRIDENRRQMEQLRRDLKRR